MRKISFYACTAATVLFAGASATSAYGANAYTYPFPGGNAIIIGGNCGNNNSYGNGNCGNNGNYGGNNCNGGTLDDLKNMLGQLQGTMGGGNFNFPNITFPGGSQTQPETPIIPDKDTPSVPDADDLEQSGSVSQDEYAAQVVKLVNEERAKMGLKALTVNTKAEKAALVRAKELEKSFSHTRPNGSDFSTALAAAGVNYQSAGENIAYGQKTPAAVMRDWMNSSGHRANILGNYTSIAVVHYQSASGVDYWEQLFIR